MVNSHI